MHARRFRGARRAEARSRDRRTRTVVAKHLPRILLGSSAAALAAGGLVHAAAFPGAVRVIAAANLPAFYANAYEALWLSDSATLMGLALVFGFIAARPSTSMRRIILLLALTPAASAVLIYAFMGSFFAGHLLVASALAAIMGGLNSSQQQLQSRTTDEQRKRAPA